MAICRVNIISFHLHIRLRVVNSAVIVNKATYAPPTDLYSDGSSSPTDVSSMPEVYPVVVTSAPLESIDQEYPSIYLPP